MRVTDASALIALKQNDQPGQHFVIPICNDEGVAIGDLVAIDQALCRDDDVIADLTEWRQRYMAFFLTQFPATVDRTRKWLSGIVLPAPDRILFLLRDQEGRFVGNLGLCNITGNSVEFDNLIRGRETKSRHIARHAMRSLMKWAFEDPAITIACLHVFSNNKVTINLHERNGFRFEGSHSLTRRATADGISYVLDAPDGPTENFSYNKMILLRENFIRCR